MGGSGTSSDVTAQDGATMSADVMGQTIATKMAEFEKSDPVLLDTRNHSPAQLDERRALLRSKIKADLELEATTAEAVRAQALVASTNNFAASIAESHKAKLEDIALESGQWRNEASKIRAKMAELQGHLDDLQQNGVAAQNARQSVVGSIAKLFCSWQWPKDAKPKKWTDAASALKGVGVWMALSEAETARIVEDMRVLMNARSKPKGLTLDIVDAPTWKSV